MIGLFAFEFIEGNTVTRLYFMRLRRSCLGMGLQPLPEWLESKNPAF